MISSDEKDEAEKMYFIVADLPSHNSTDVKVKYFHSSAIVISGLSNYTVTSLNDFNAF